MFSVVAIVAGRNESSSASVHVNVPMVDGSSKNRNKLEVPQMQKVVFLTTDISANSEPLRIWTNLRHFQFFLLGTKLIF